MNTAAWLLLVLLAAAGVALAARARRKWAERERAEAARFAAFMSTAAAARKPTEAPAAPPAPPAAGATASAATGLATQKMLFEAARKAGEAGEPALAIQLYARLLARYPGTAFADQARAGVETQKQRLAKA